MCNKSKMKSKTYEEFVEKFKPKRKKIEKAEKIYWELSDREKEIIKSLDRKE